MFEKSGVFKIWLVGIAKSEDFVDGIYSNQTMHAIGNHLRNMFARICHHPNSSIASAAFLWDGGTPSPVDVVIYVLAHRSDSIINKNGGQPIHRRAPGGTYLHDTGMISEIYLKEIEASGSFAKLAANLIFHEIMHNKLDAAIPQSVSDIHGTGGAGLAHPFLSPGSQMTPRNIELMAEALSKRVHQYTGEIREPNLEPDPNEEDTDLIDK